MDTQEMQSSEDRETLARLATSAENSGAHSEVAIEKYLRSVLAVENELTLDRLRQVCVHVSIMCVVCYTACFYVC